MATSVYKITSIYRGEPKDSDAYTKFAVAMEHVSGAPLFFEQTEACTENGIAVYNYGAVTGFIENEISTATFVLTGHDRAGTQYTATVTIANLTTNTTITLETA